MNTKKSPPTKPGSDENKGKERQDLTQRRMRYSVSYAITSLIALWLFQQFVLMPLLVQGVVTGPGRVTVAATPARVVDGTAVAPRSASPSAPSAEPAEGEPKVE